MRTVWCSPSIGYLSLLYILWRFYLVPEALHNHHDPAAHILVPLR
jgi:hypothetical protein